MSDVEPSNPAFQSLSADNHGPAVVVASYLFLALSVITVITRCWNRYRVARSFQADDVLIGAATVLAFAQTISLTLSVNKGLGRQRDDISTSEFLAAAKAYYASELLAIPALLCAKLSTALLILSIQPTRGVKIACQAVSGVTLVWSIAAFFVLAFHCDLPTPWNYEGKCLDLQAVNIANGAWNISTDIALVLLPVFMMRKVHVTSHKRWTVNALFGARIVVPGFAIAALVTAGSMYTSNPSNLTWDVVPPSIWYQCVINFSIITACVPCIKRFLADLSVGITVVAISEPMEMTIKNSSGTHPTPRGNPTHSRLGVFSSFMRSRADPTSQMKSSASHTTSSLEKGTDEYGKAPDFQPEWATRNRPTIERSESIQELRQNIIVQTIDYEVNYEGHPQTSHATQDGGSSLEGEPRRTTYE